MTALSLLEWEGAGEVGQWETPQESGFCSVMEARAGKSWHFSFLLFLRLPQSSSCWPSPMWTCVHVCISHIHNAIFKKREGVLLAGSFCGLAKCIFPDLTQQPGKVGKGWPFFIVSLAFLVVLQAHR